MAKQNYLEKQLEFDFMKERPFQFGLRDLLGLVTFTSIGLAVGKTLVDYDAVPQNSLDRYLILVFGMITATGYCAYKSSRLE